MVSITGIALGMNRLDDRVRSGGQKAVNKVGSGDGFRLGATVTLELGPDSGEAKQGSVVVQRKPNDILLTGRGIRLRRIFGEAVYRDQAATFRLQPCSPVARAL